METGYGWNGTGYGWNGTGYGWSKLAYAIKGTLSLIIIDKLAPMSCIRFELGVVLSYKA